MIKERRRKKRGNLSRKNFNSDFDDSEESEKNKNLEQIVDELEEPMEEIESAVEIETTADDQVKQHPDKTAEEIYNLINNE